MNGYDRLKELYQKDYQNTPIIKIINYLLKQPDMDEKYLNEEKSIKQMYQYIIKKAGDYKVDNTAVVDDETVYGWAIDYFNISNEELGLDIKETIQCKTKPKEEKKDDDNQMQLSLEFA